MGNEKKIGIMASGESEFAQTFIRHINNRRFKHITAEYCQISAFTIEDYMPYSVIIDRISHMLPFYQVYLKAAVLRGAYVINNPFWFKCDDKFFNYSVAASLGIPIPKTVCLPQKGYEYEWVPVDLINLTYPQDWESICRYIGFPAILKPVDGFGWRDVYTVHNFDELIHTYDRTGSKVMIMQELIEFEDYMRIFVLGKKRLIATKYIPDQRRYVTDQNIFKPELLDRTCEYAIALCNVLGYDMNTVEFAIRDGVPYAIDFMNPVPDGNPQSITYYYFREFIRALADTAIELVESYDSKLVQSQMHQRFIPAFQPYLDRRQRSTQRSQDVPTP